MSHTPTCYCGRPLDLSYFEVHENHTIFDTFITHNHPQRFNLFTIPVGQSNKDWYDTNMIMSGCLPAPQWFICKSVHLVLDEASDKRFADSYKVTFSLGMEQVFELEAKHLLVPQQLNGNDGVVIGQQHYFNFRFDKTSPEHLGYCRGRVNLNGTWYKEKP